MKGVRMLTRKYYKMIARVIKNNTIIHNEHNRMLAQVNKAGLVTDLCKELKLDNHNFNEFRFINACEDDF